AAAKKAAKYIAQVAKIKVDVLAAKTFEPTAKRITTRAARPAHAGVAKLVVALALLRIFQHLVGFVYLLKLSFVAALFVRMVLHGKPAKRLLNLVGARILPHSQYFVIIPFTHDDNLLYGSTTRA